MRWRRLWPLVLLAACDARPVSAPPPPLPLAPRVVVHDAGTAASPPRPVVVALVVDQLSAWVADSRFPALPGDGGISRLVKEGTWIKTLRYAHAVTDTAPGHAALHTGKTPAESGIFGNELPLPDGSRTTVLLDDTAQVVTAGGRVKRPGSSPARLRAVTTAERLLAAEPDALVVSLSLKDRGAILPAGRGPKRVVWFDTPLDQFVSSTAYGETLPAWVTGHGDHDAVERARNAPWVPTDATWLASHAATRDDAPGEGDLDGLGTTFPHVARSAKAFRSTPASDARLLAMALAAVDAEYDPKKTTLLLVSLSASDVIGHVFGPDSWEAWDHLRKLDLALGTFLAALEKRTGVAPRVLLSGDHGNLSMPEATEARNRIPACRAKSGAPDPLERPCTAGVRLPVRGLGDELTRAVKKVLGPGDFIAGAADPYVFLTPLARALPKPRRKQLHDVVLDVCLRGHADGVLSVYDVRDLVDRCPAVLAVAKPSPERAAAHEDVLTLVCRSFVPDAGAGDYYVVPRQGTSFDAELVIGKGASHGTPWLYDRTVPMFVLANGMIGAGVETNVPVDFSAYAAIEAALVGLDRRGLDEIVRAHSATGAAP